MAQGRSYDVIVLDSRLPKLSGDDVLERLRREGDWTPVLMLTAYPDYESAHRSGVLGASRYLLKSMTIGAPLTTAIRVAALGTVAPSKTSRLFSAYGGKTSRSFSDLVAYVRSDGVNASDLPRQLARTISARDLTFAEFLATSKCLQFLNHKAHLPFHVALSTLHEWLDPGSTARPFGSGLIQLLTHLERSGRDWAKICASSFMDIQGNDHASDHGTDLASPSFHQCKKAVVMRRAVLELLRPNEQIRQIAYGLGYSDHGNFGHDFFRFFGVAPRHFRRLS